MLDGRLDAYTEEELKSFVLRLIADRTAEDLRLDYKAGTALEGQRWKGEAAKDVSAFANSAGGMLVYGVREDAQTNAPDGSEPGTDYAPDFEGRLFQVLNSAILPRPFDIAIRRLEFPAGTVVLVQIPSSPLKPHWVSYDHRFYFRTGRESRPMAEHEIERAYRERAQVEARPKAIADSVWVRGVLHDAPAGAAPWASRYLAVPLMPSPERPQYWAFRGVSGIPAAWRAAPRGVETARQWEHRQLQIGDGHWDISSPKEYYSVLDDGVTVMWDEAVFNLDAPNFPLWDWAGESARLDHFLRISNGMWRRMHCTGPVIVRVQPSWWSSDFQWPNARLRAQPPGPFGFVRQLEMAWPIDAWDAEIQTSTSEITEHAEEVTLRGLQALFRFFGENALPAGVEEECRRAIQRQRRFVEGIQ